MTAGGNVWTRLEAGKLQPGEFGHAGHVEAAWHLLSEAGFGEAVTRYSAALRRVTVTMGVPEKYHETVTVAFLALVAERRAAGDDADFMSFRAANGDLFDSGILKRYYAPEVLAGETARHVFVLPIRTA